MNGTVLKIKCQNLDWCAYYINYPPGTAFNCRADPLI